MADYCYIPPFVTDPTTPPNVMIAYERDSDIIEQIYDTDFSNSISYVGFFDANSNYTYDTTNDYLEKSTTCTTSAANLNCIPGRVLNWGLMSGLDLSRRVIVGFGWNGLGNKGAGDVFTYKGCFLAGGTTSTCEACTDAKAPPAGCQTPISYGYWDEGTLSKPATVTIGASNYSYNFCLSKASGSNPTGVTIVAATGNSAPACPNNQGACTALGVGCIKYNGRVAMRFTDEDRRGIIQKFADKDKNYIYDSDGIRFGIRRWNTGTDKQRDIIRDTPSLDDTQKQTVFRALLNATTKAPPVDGDTPLSDMMYEIRNYFSGLASKYSDGSGGDAALTQTPYAWATDPAEACRKNFVIFVTRGTNLGTQTATNDCPSDTSAFKSKFSEQTCYAFSNDLYTTTGTGKQNIRTYMVHVSFHLGIGAANVDQIKHATVDVGGGQYVLLTNPTELQSKLEEALLNILSTSASASTVATLTTQSRESSTLTQAYFYPKRENTPLKWIGYLRLLWSDSGANLREDTANRGWLDLKKDKILSFWYSSDGCNSGPCYRGMLFNDATGDLIIDGCYAATNNNTINNEAVSAIWNAQDKLLARTTDDRAIKVGIGNTSGVVSSSTCVSNSGFCDFTTALNTTLRPYLSYASYCSDNTSRWCASDAGCNYCTTLRNTYSVDRACTVASQASDCAYCNGKKSDKCTTTLTCSDGVTAGCVTAGAVCGTGVCVGDCYKYYGTCTAGTLVCDVDYSTSCATLGSSCTVGTSTGTCVRGCSLNTNIFCSTGTCVTNKCSNNTAISCTLDSDCNNAQCVTDNRGTGFTGSACITTDTCTPAILNRCTQDCDDNCAKSVIKFMRGYDKPTTSAIPTGPESPGKDFRLRTQCIAASDCQPPAGGTCGSGVCSVSAASCSPVGSTCSGNGGTCYGTCSDTSYDITKTLKLGDIVYSTPRISPNSAVNGYDVTYKDTSYGNWINSKIKGNCTTSADCPMTSDKTSSENQSCPAGAGVCTGTTTIGDGYTPIVILGANDGMVHAFKVSKIKDLSPTQTNCGGLTCTNADGTTITDGNQISKFADLPRSSLAEPPTDLGKEMWAYIPFNAIPYLRWYCDKSYCHIPMVDARFSVIDASIDYDHNGTIDATESGRTATSLRCDDSGSYTCPNYPWRRLLVGTMGVGGKKITVGNNTWSSSIFALDITDPTSPVLLWEKPLPDNTLTTSTPSIVRLGAKDANGTWYLVMGSGAQSVTTNALNYKKVCSTTTTTLCTSNSDCPSGETCSDAITAANAKIFVFDLRTGALSATLDVGASGVAVGDLMATDMDSDYQVDDIYFGTYGGTTGNYKGKLYRLRLRDNSGNYQTDPAQWIIETVVVPGGVSDGNGRPIFASPEVAQDENGNIWLYFGTGVYLTLEHATATPTVNEYLYGLKETPGCWKGTTTPRSACTYSNSNFLDTTSIEFKDAIAAEAGCFCAGNLLRSVSCDASGTCAGCTSAIDEKTIITSVTDATLYESGVTTGCAGKKDKAAIDCLSTLITTSYNGWKRAITGQKIFSKPFVAGGLADFTSFEPTSTTCSLGGNTWLISLHYTTGTAYVQPTIYAAGGTTPVGTKYTINASANLGTGVPPLGESLVALPLSGDTYKVITQVSGGLPGTTMAPSTPAKSGYVLWLTK